MIASNPKLKIIHDRVKLIPPIDPGHDFSHTLRVAKLTEKVYLAEKCGGSDFDRAQAWVAALLHDCVPVAKNSPLRKDSSRLCAEKAREWLTEVQWGDTAAIDDVCSAILTHSFSAGIPPKSLLGCALQDADRLEALGALGLYRTIATGVSMGTVLFDVNDPWAENRDLDDKKFTIDHFFTKLLKLPDTFKTASARDEARRRVDFLQTFLAQLRSEI